MQTEKKNASSSPIQREDKVKNFHLSFVFAVHLPFQMKTWHYSGGAWNMLSRETFARPILLWASVLGGHNHLKYLITMWKWNPLRDFSTSKFQLPLFAIGFIFKHTFYITPYDKQSAVLWKYRIKSGHWLNQSAKDWWLDEKQVFTCITQSELL